MIAHWTRAAIAAAVLCASSAMAPNVAARAQNTTSRVHVPPDVMINVKTVYGAKGDGVSDDTAAIQRALDDGRRNADGSPIYPIPDQLNGRPKSLFFPKGVYRVSDTLSWAGCCVTLQGEGPVDSIIQLADGAPGYADPAMPKPVIQTENGNMAFRNNVWDLGVNTGRSNAGAIGLDWIANNTGALRNVRIVSGDGQGVAGLDMTRIWPGPSLAKHVFVDGFDYGIRVGTPEYAPVFEHIEVRNQRKAGMWVDKNVAAIRAFTSTNTVPALVVTTFFAQVTLLDATFNGGAASESAIHNAGYLYARNIATTGYARALSGTLGTAIDEYVSGDVRSLFEANPPRRSLGLSVAETPAFHDADPAQWSRFTPSEYGRTEALQPALNAGKSTVYFNHQVLLSYNERAVTVPAGVRRIVGFSAVVNSDANGVNGGGIKFIVQDDSPDPLIIEQFGYGVKVEHRSRRTVVLKHGHYQYTGTPNAGDLYLEDVGIEPIKIHPGQRVWARQFNNEYGGTKVLNDGGQFWLFGMKTERGGTVVETINGGKTEFFGGLIYPATAIDQNTPAFVDVDSDVSAIWSAHTYCANCGYAIQMRETRLGVTRQITANGGGSFLMPLYVGFDSAPPAPTMTPDPTLTRKLYLPVTRRR
jgi:hypothetical protein